MTLQVFISYKSEYREFARAVKSELNQWGFDTWLDVDNIQPGDYFRHKIQAGLDSSDVLLMVLTEEAQLSREVMSEVDYFLDVAKKPVVPLLHRECKPLYIFVSIQYIDFISNQANGFVHLKQRLSELANSVLKESPIIEDMIVVPQKPGGAATPDSFGTEITIEKEETELASSSEFGGLVLTSASKPTDDKRVEAEPEKSLQRESEKKEAVLDDLLAEPAPLKPANAPEPPKPQPASPPPPPLEQQVPSGLPASPPATTAPFQPTRQQPDFMPQQPAALGRKRSNPILLPLAAVASLVIVVGAIVLLSSNAAVINTTQQPQGMSPLVWVGLLVILGVVGVFGWQRFGRLKTGENLRSSPTDDAKNRATMLQNVEDFWLKGVLDPALEAGSLDIGLSAAPGAVLRHKDYGDYALPPNANILDVFNDLNRELLILGAPGGGKTVLLLQLARELIAQARQDIIKAIPVVFNLSSWAAERKPLADWLVDELRQKYQVPKKVATAWVEGEKLLLLLDGLDEVAEQYQNECVDAINSFRQKYRTVDLAICSRAADYDALTSKLDVRGAIVLEPLSQPVIDDYLNRPELANLRELMATDAELREMSQVPFLLNAMAYAYSGATPTNLQFPASSDAAKARRNHLFDWWVEKRLAAKPSVEYTPNKGQRWLECLAEKMWQYEKIIFFINADLQPNWVIRSKDERLYQLCIRLTFGLAFGLTVGLTFGLMIGLGIGGVLVALGIALILGLVAVPVGILRTPENILSGTPLNQETRQASFSPMWELRTVGQGIGIASGFISGVLYLIARDGSVDGRIILLIVGLVGFVVGILVGVMAGNGFTLLQRLILRIILWRSGDTPWNYARFLNYCVSAGLMRKVGGGYIFAHRYLLEYFAELGVK